MWRKPQGSQLFKQALCHLHKKQGHITKMCHSHIEQQHTIFWVLTCLPDLEDKSDEVHVIYNLPDSQSNPIQVTLNIKNQDVLMEVDTEASLSIMSEKTSTLDQF